MWDHCQIGGQEVVEAVGREVEEAVVEAVVEVVVVVVVGRDGAEGVVVTVISIGGRASLEPKRFAVRCVVLLIVVVVGHGLGRDRGRGVGQGGVREDALLFERESLPDRACERGVGRRCREGIINESMARGEERTRARLESARA